MLLHKEYYICMPLKIKFIFETKIDIQIANRVELKLIREKT